jgi:hypothetical protein
MKLKILNALKTVFEGVDEKILNRIAEKLAKTVTAEEEVQPAVDGVTFQQIIEAEADRRATEATQTAVANYERKHGLKDGQKTEAGDANRNNGPDSSKTPDSGGDKVSMELITAAVAAAVKPVSDELNALKSGKVTDERKLKLDAVTGKLPDNLRKPYNRISLKDMTDEEFDTFITEATAEVDGVVADLAAKGAVLKAPIGGATVKKEPSKEEAAEILSGII